MEESQEKPQSACASSSDETQTSQANSLHESSTPQETKLAEPRSSINEELALFIQTWAIERETYERSSSEREPLLKQLQAETDWIVKARSALSIGSAGFGAKAVDTILQGGIFNGAALACAVLCTVVGLVAAALDLFLLHSSIKQIRDALDIVNLRVELGAAVDQNRDHGEDNPWQQENALSKAHVLKTRKSEFDKNQATLIQRNLWIYILICVSVILFMSSCILYAEQKSKMANDKPKPTPTKPSPQPPQKIERSYGAPPAQTPPQPKPPKK